MKALDLCIKNNYFEFHGKVYKQVGGVGTGVKLAPTYACLGLGKFEDLAFNSNQDLIDLILLWKRYIDDVFALFKGDKNKLQELVIWLNSLMPGVVKFTCDYSKKKVEFLDLEILIENGKLETNLFIKPTNLQLYLDYFSNHPKHCKEGLVYSQALRIIEICSKENDKEVHLSNLKDKLMDRNYPKNLINKKFHKARQHNRRDLIFKQRKPPQKDDKIRLVFTHTAANPPIHKWLREGKKHLSKNERTRAIGKKIQIASKQPKNLLRIVRSSNFNEGAAPPQNQGCHKCNKCHACPIVLESSHFQSTKLTKI